jgi:hypothetical protein
MPDQFCCRTLYSIAEKRWSAIVPPDEALTCYKLAHFTIPTAMSQYVGDLWVCADCYDDWTSGDCFTKV